MSDTGVSRRKCPECGSEDLGFLVSKPPMVVCKKCGYQTIWKASNPTDKTDKSDNKKNK